LQLKRVRAEVTKTMNTTSSSYTSINTSKTADSLDSKAETIYSAQSTGEFNMSAIHYSLDFEGWVNSQLNKMYREAAECVGKEIRFEFDVVEQLLPFPVEEGEESARARVGKRRERESELVKTKD